MQSELVIEGILESCDANSTHIILNEAIILRVYGGDPHNSNARSELIRRAEKASVNMAEVREVRFMGVNVTKDGMQPVSIKQPKALSSIENIELKVEEVCDDLKTQVSSPKDSISEPSS